MTQPTYKDIQERTGLSLATISKYFNGGTVREPNRVAIEAAVSALDYRVNVLARGLRSKRSRSVGVVLPELNNNFHSSIMNGVEGALKVAGVSVLVCSSHGQDDAESTVNFLLDRQVDGIIAVPTRQVAAALRKVHQAGIPLVLVDRLLSGVRCDSVVLDNRAAAARAAEELLAFGHHKIAVITGTADVWTMQERLEGFAERLKQDGVGLPDQSILRGPLAVDFGRSAARTVLSDDAHTAIFSTNFELTMGTLMELNRGPDTSGRLSLVGFDGANLAAVTTPRTSVIVQPIHEFGAVAAELMLRRLSEPGPGLATRCVVLHHEWLQGESVTALVRQP